MSGSVDQGSFYWGCLQLTKEAVGDRGFVGVRENPKGHNCARRHLTGDPCYSEYACISFP